MNKRARLLYIFPGPVPPRARREINKFYHLSRDFEGHILSIRWGKNNQEGRAAIKEANQATGDFLYCPTHSWGYPWYIKIFWDLGFYLSKGLWLYYFSKGFDVIIAYGPYRTGIAGYLLKLLTRAKLIIDVPGTLGKSFSYSTPESLEEDVPETPRSALARRVAAFVLRRADHVKLLFPGQLGDVVEIPQNRLSVFHDFVPIHTIEAGAESDKFILFIGYPWLLKGVDILIEAFNRISPQFPEYRLKIVGYCSDEDRNYFSKLKCGNEKIELGTPLPSEEAMKLMSSCTLFVLPSRTEAMGRVLLEAMAAKKPIVASRVDGIPYYISDGENGLLFDSEDVDQLAEKMQRILEDPAYASSLAENGYQRVYSQYSEEAFLDHYLKMIQQVFGREKDVR